MGELINGKTPEEIKHGLRCEDPCSVCAYFKEDCSNNVERDAIALIERLEAKLARRDNLLAEMGVSIPKEAYDGTE